MVAGGGNGVKVINSKADQEDKGGDGCASSPSFSRSARRGQRSSGEEELDEAGDGADERRDDGQG